MNSLSVSIPKREIVIPMETRLKLEIKLQKFEKSKQFLDPHMSLSLLSASLQSNAKYISYMINTYKEKDFSNYINELRIRYIIERLISTSHYRKYKIATLAKECGFSSAGKFAVIFKKHTSYSPSTFIETLGNYD